MYVWQGHRVADGEMADDTMRENTMLKTENLSLRQRVRALQETVESMTARNAQLQADRDRLTLTSSLSADGNSRYHGVE